MALDGGKSRDTGLPVGDGGRFGRGRDVDTGKR